MGGERDPGKIVGAPRSGNRRVRLAFAQYLAGVSYPPSTLILDRQGRIAVALRKPTTVAELQPLVERVAGEAEAS